MNLDYIINGQRLDWSIYLSFIGVVVVLCTPRDKTTFIRVTALLTAVAGLAVAVHGFWTYDLGDAARVAGSGARDEAAVAFARSFKQFEVTLPWIPSLGISYHLGADGISLPLLVLNGVVAVTGVLFSWNVTTRTKEFFAFFLLLIAGVYGVFLSLDVFLLFAFYEFAIIPKYFVIAIWGSTRKEYAAMKLVLYSFVGSAFVFVGILAVYFATGVHSFDLFTLMQASSHLSDDFQFWCFPFLFFGFAVLAGMWPFHTWAPTGHSAAPTAASMLLAGVVMKLGAYGCLRVAMLLLPRGMSAHDHFWQWVIGFFAVTGIVYGATVALVQKDFKFVIGYSSVSHMGFVLLGLMTLNTIGLDGAVLQMFSHGIVASLLFAIVGRMVYERTHTRDLDVLSGLGLARKLPFVAVCFVIGGLASMGLPGFSGFVAELQVLAGAWERFPIYVLLSGLGILVTVWYTLRAVHLGFFGDARFLGGEHAKPDPSTAPILHSTAPMPPVTLPERVAAVLLIAILVVVGVYPSLLLDMIDNSVKLMLPALAGGG